ncbi:MAG: leucine-rich repeat domain-containing protein [Muribaculaceae bacterium]|nr:leucine-rich repeat domain-containing protein [Muribaculaceae bacterium]
MRTKTETKFGIRVSVCVFLITLVSLMPTAANAWWSFEDFSELTEDDWNYVRDLKYDNSGVYYQCFIIETFPVQLEVLADPRHADLTEVIIPESIPDLINSIWTAEPLQYTKMKFVPAVVGKVGAKAFYKSKIEKISLSSTVKFIGDRAFESSSLENITIPEGVVFIGDRAFARSRLKDIVIPESIKYLGAGCFYGCATMGTVVLPSTLERLNGDTFANAYPTDIYCYAENPPLASISDFSIFESKNMLDCLPDGPWDAGTILHVPAESIELYKLTEPWKYFPQDRIVPIETTQSDETYSDRDDMSYVVANGEISVFGAENDIIEIFAVDGRRLAFHQFTSPSSFVYHGAGVIILSFNGKSLKISL